MRVEERRNWMSRQSNVSDARKGRKVKWKGMEIFFTQSVFCFQGLEEEKEPNETGCILEVMKKERRERKKEKKREIRRKKKKTRKKEDAEKKDEIPSKDEGMKKKKDEEVSRFLLFLLFYVPIGMKRETRSEKEGRGSKRKGVEKKEKNKNEKRKKKRKKNDPMNFFASLFHVSLTRTKKEEKTKRKEKHQFFMEPNLSPSSSLFPTH